VVTGTAADSAEFGIMVLSIACEGCQKPLRIREEFAGKRVKCPACGHVQVAAAPEQTAPVAETPLPPPPPPRLELDEPGDEEIEDVLLVPGQEAIAPGLPPHESPPPPRPRRRPSRRHQDDEVAEIACPYCQTFIPADVEMCPECTADIDDEEVEELYARLKKERTFLSAMSWVFGILGLLLLLGSGALQDVAKSGALGDVTLPAAGMAILGFVLLMIGFGFAAVCRGHNPAWALLGLLCLAGLLILLILLVVLPDDKGRRLLRLKNLLRERRALGFRPQRNPAGSSWSAS
jgi:hypothetical protein